MPEFLSDHPEPAARVADINSTAQELGCRVGPAGTGPDWRSFQASLPPLPESPAEDDVPAGGEDSPENSDDVAAR